MISKSYDELKAEMEDLLQKASRGFEESALMQRRAEELRLQSIDLRRENPMRAEELWAESERLCDDCRELIRRSVQDRIRAGEIKRRLEIHDQIEAVGDDADMIWKKALKAWKS